MTKTKQPEHFTTGKWGEFDQWRCVYCPWDTLEGEAAILEHYIATHMPPPPPPKPVIIPTYNRFGILVTPEPPTPVEDGE